MDRFRETDGAALARCGRRSFATTVDLPAGPAGADGAQCGVVIEGPSGVTTPHSAMVTEFAAGGDNAMGD